MNPTHIIIHHSLTRDGETVSWQAIRRYHMQELGWSDCGYHAGVEIVAEIPEVLLGRWFTTVGAHCLGMNDKSIGICVVGNFDDEDQARAMLTDGRFQTLIRLVNNLASLFDIPASRICPHRQFAAHKTCPGAKFPWDLFMDGIGG